MEIRSLAAAVMWTAAIAMAVARVFTETTGLTVWAILFGQSAMTLTGWMIFERVSFRLHCEEIAEMRSLDDKSVERIAVRLADVLRQEGKLSPLR